MAERVKLTEHVNDGAHDALNRMRRAHERGTGCHLTAEMIAGLASQENDRG